METFSYIIFQATMLRILSGGNIYKLRKITFFGITNVEKGDKMKIV